MKKHLLSLTLLMLISASGMVYAHTHIRIDASFYSQALDEVKNVDVYLPGDYYQNDTVQYPVIYFLHGAAANHNDYGVLAIAFYSMIASGEIHPFIMVKPDGSCEPYHGSMYANSVLYGNYEDYIVEDVINFTEQNFRTIPSKYARYIAGHSMGGGGSLNLSIKHPDLFRGLVCSSNDPAKDVVQDFWRELLYLENDSSYHFSYNAGIYTQLYFTGCGAYSPNLSLTPPVEHFWDTSGNIVDSVKTKWMAFDPEYIVQNLAPTDSVAFFLTCGTEDEMNFYPSNLVFLDTLDKYDLDYVFRPYEGTHAHDVEAFMDGYRFIDSLYTQALIHLAIGDISQEISEICIYPNPVVELAQIIYTLDQPASVHINILNAMGSIVWQSDVRNQYPANHTINLDIRHLPSGIYLCRLQVGNQSVVKRLVKL
ncbi:MAG: T9SS type A sorting domain-containing protein [Bacteroidia bacterium]|nr:T9SS type A sorting domain-containing protein [Bacteroidia bacterium]